MGTGVEPGERKRQRREVVKARLRAALEELAAENSFRDITVADLTSATGLSRSAFYFYYDDKRDLLIETVRAASKVTFDQINQRFLAEKDPQEVVHEVLCANADAWCDHADVIRLAIEASVYDEEVRAFWRGVIGDFITAVAARIRSDQERGITPAGLDPLICADFLVTATEGFFYRRLSRGDETPSQAVAALEPIWLQLLYP
jgi:AcrR family transcriptional regulator